LMKPSNIKDVAYEISHDVLNDILDEVDSVVGPPLLEKEDSVLEHGKDVDDMVILVYFFLTISLFLL